MQIYSNENIFQCHRRQTDGTLYGNSHHFTNGKSLNGRVICNFIARLIAIKVWIQSITLATVLYKTLVDSITITWHFVIEFNPIPILRSVGSRHMLILQCCLWLLCRVKGSCGHSCFNTSLHSLFLLVQSVFSNLSELSYLFIVSLVSLVTFADSLCLIMFLNLVSLTI